jgi:hypothetical protein
MDATYPPGVVFPGVPGKKRRTGSALNPFKNSADQTVTREQRKPHAKNTTGAPKRLFSPQTPSDDAYHLGHMIYTL